MSWSVQLLRKSGRRLTAIREAIALHIERRKGVFSAHDIMMRFPRADKVTVYRTIELLAECDIIHPVATLNGAQYYEVHGNAHHHHIICTSCRRSACIACAVPSVKVPGFEKPHHTFLLTGLCRACAKNA